MMKVRKIQGTLKRLTPLLVFLIITIIFFKDYFLKGLVPIPGDIIIGSYYPWLNQKWDHVVGVAVKNPPMSDVVSLMYPWRFVVINYFKNAQLPLWDPTQFMGISLIGNFQAAIFNPFNLLFLLPLSFNLVWGFQVVAQPFIAMVSMYLLIRTWNLPKLSAYFAAVSYAFSAQMIVWCEYNLLGFLIAVFPLFFYLINNYLKNNKSLSLIYLSLLVAFSVFAGYPQLVYYIIFFSSLYFTYQICKEKISHEQKLFLLIKFCLAIIVGLGIAAVQLLPGFEMTTNSIRNFDQVAWQNKSTFLPYESLMTTLSPDFFGNPATYNYWGKGYYESFALYTSLVLLILTIFSFQNKKHQELKTFLFFILVITLIFALNTPISNYIQSMGIFGLKGSVNARIIFVYAFCISILGSIGLETILDDSKLKRGLFYILLVPAALIGILMWTWLIYTFFPSTASSLQISFRNTLFPLFISVFSAMVILLFLRTRKTAILLILFILLIIDVFRFGYKYLPFTSENEIFPKTPTVNFLDKSNGLFRIGIEKAELFPANTWTPFQLQSPSGYNILVPKDTLQFLSYLNHEKPNLEDKRFVEVINFDSKLLDLINTKYVLALLRTNNKPDPAGSLPQNIQNPKFEPVLKEGNVLILQNKKVLPRFFTVDKFLVIDSNIQALDYLISDQFVPDREVVLNKHPGLENLSKCKLSLLKYTGQKFIIQSHCQGNSLLVLTESYDEGWKAKINGSAVPVYKADANFIAIPLTSGDSLIEIFYLPNSFIVGSIISIVSILLILPFLILKIVRHYFFSHP